MRSPSVRIHDSRSLSMRVVLGAFVGFAGLCLASRTLAQEPDRATSKDFGLYQSTGKPSSGVVDKAGLFSPDAVKRAISELERIEKNYHFATIIETVDKLGDT